MKAHFVSILRNCAPACRSCEYIDFNHRCPFDAGSPESREKTMWVEPGDLNSFFWRIANNETYRQRHKLSVLSGPVAALSIQNGAEHTKERGDTSGEDEPWLIQLEHFLTAFECNRLIELGHGLGYEQSKDIGRRKFDGTYDSKVSDSRTSTTAWCSVGTDCFNDRVMESVSRRIEELSEIHRNYSEYIQLLRYEKGQKYVLHHDYTSNHVDRAQGVRILTVFLYLSDSTDEMGLEGGGTNFPKMRGNITVYPKKGRAVLWPSVLNNHPGKRDQRTEHQALPVEEGIKYGANAWIHERDFRTPFVQGCAK